MADTSQTLDAVLARLDALEHENQTLRRKVAHLEAAATVGHSAALPTMDAPVNRRHVLRRAVQATAATVAAGVLLQRDEQQAGANHSTAVIDADTVNAHYLRATSETGSFAVWALTNSGAESSAIQGANNGAGQGVLGVSSGGIGVSGVSNGFEAGVEGRSAGGNGVQGTGVYGVYGEGKAGVYGVSSTTGWEGVYGKHTGAFQGFGVVGDATGASGAGVLGRHAAAVGVRGEGRIGVSGKSTASAGYGVVAEGGKAQLRLVPKSTAGKPTSGAHSKGELFLDSAVSLWICTVAGTPGTWRKVSTTAT